MRAKDDARDAFEFRRNPPAHVDQGTVMDKDDFFNSSKPTGSSLDMLNFSKPDSTNSSPDPSSTGGGVSSFYGQGGPTPGPPIPGSPGGPGGSFSVNPATQGVNPARPQAQQDDYLTKGVETLIDFSINAAVSATKGSYKGSKVFVSSFTSEQTTKMLFAQVGNRMLYAGLGISVLSLVLKLFGLFIPMGKVLPVLLGGLFSIIIGLVVMAFTYDPKGVPSLPEEALPEPGEEEEDVVEPSPSPQFELDYSDIEEDDDDDYDEDEVWGDEDDDDDYWEDDNDLAWETNPQSTDIDSAVNAIDEITPGTQTRAYLIEQYKKILPHSTPGFSTWKEYTQDDDEFIVAEEYIQEAARQYMSGSYDMDDLPLVESVRENLYILSITCTRPSNKFKVDKTANELCMIYASREWAEKNGLPRQGVFAMHRAVGGTATIDIFKSGPLNDKGDIQIPIVTLADAVSADTKWLSNPDIDMPVYVGVSERGDVLRSDFRSLYSMLLSGEPRSGKSWLTTSIVCQMAMYTSPRHMVIYAGDTKGTTSDWYSMRLPHVKHFAGTVNDIVKMVKWVSEVEGPRRKAFLGKEGYQDYNDFVREQPERQAEMPLLYLVIDELTALMSSLDENKDLKAEYNNHLLTIVSQYPGMGIRFIGIPHRIVNDIIAKNTYALISGTVTVKASSENLKNTFSVTKSDFPYELSSAGQSAVKIPGLNGGRVTYSSNIALTSSNRDTKNVFEFVRQLWSRLDHEYYHGPRIDELDRKAGVFDNYECGCKSRGGLVKAVSTAAQPARGPLAGIKGGYKGQETSVYRRGNETVVDVTDSMDIDFDDNSGFSKLFD